MASDGRGLLTFSGTVPPQNPTKVKATVATIPVGTESVTKHTEVIRKLNLFLFSTLSLRPWIVPLLA